MGRPMSTDYLRDVDSILRYLPEDYSALADKYDVLRLQHGNAKITTARELLWIFFVHVGLNLPLRQTAAVVHEAGGPSVSPMRIHKKLIRSVPFLEAMLARMAPLREERSSEQWLGYRVSLIDATTLCGPGATGTDARIHTVMDIADMRVSRVEVTDGKGGETLTRFNWEEGELIVGDRGYSHPRGIAHAYRQGAAVLIRLNWHALPLQWHGGQDADIMEWLRTLEGHKSHERAVRFSTKDGTEVHGRVIARRLKAGERSKAIEWVRREHKAKDITPQMLERAGYMVLFTTSKLSAHECVQLYRLRWQIELLFKRWKSLCGFDHLPNYRDDTILAWIYLKVILGIILEQMGSATAGSFSPGAKRDVAA